MTAALIAITGAFLVLSVLQQRRIDRLQRNHATLWTEHTVLAERLYKLQQHQLSDAAGLKGLLKTLGKFQQTLREHGDTLSDLQSKDQTS